MFGVLLGAQYVVLCSVCGTQTVVDKVWVQVACLPACYRKLTLTFICSSSRFADSAYLACVHLVQAKFA